MLALTIPSYVLADEIPMVFVPAGEFIMGATLEEQQQILTFGWEARWQTRIEQLVKSSGPQRVVFVNSFYIDTYEVTNRAYREFVRTTGYPEPVLWQSRLQVKDPDQPVVGISWFDAQAFCAWKEKRLPTEAEWEKAARGTDARQYPWGNSWEADHLHTADLLAGRSLENFELRAGWQRTMYENLATARPGAIGAHPSGVSPYGAMDMAGNVWEWVADWYAPDYYRSAPKRNPTGPEGGTTKVLRGGGWDVPKVIPVTWLREHFIPPRHTGSPVTGFRCAATQRPGLIEAKAYRLRAKSLR